MSSQRVDRFFNQPLGGNYVYQILLTMSTQFVSPNRVHLDGETSVLILNTHQIGFSLAGLTRRFLVYRKFLFCFDIALHTGIDV